MLATLERKVQLAVFQHHNRMVTRSTRAIAEKEETGKRMQGIYPAVTLPGFPASNSDFDLNQTGKSSPVLKITS